MRRGGMGSKRSNENSATKKQKVSVCGRERLEAGQRNGAKDSDEEQRWCGVLRSEAVSDGAAGVDGEWRRTKMEELEDQNGTGVSARASREGDGDVGKGRRRSSEAFDCDGEGSKGAAMEEGAVVKNSQSNQRTPARRPPIDSNSRKRKSQLRGVKPGIGIDKGKRVK
eukprot:jgi/Psemu1/60221/gm1.60221_g